MSPLCPDEAVAVVEVPVTKAMILTIYTDFDYRASAVTLKHLGLEDLRKRQIREYMTQRYIQEGISQFSGDG